MIKLTLQEVTTQNLQQAKNYFSEKYLDSLKNKPKESILARFLISQLVEKYYWIKNFLPKIDKNGVPVFENDIFWSISHKKDLVFVWVAKEKFWLDLEIIKTRDENLLDIFEDKEYKLLWGKSWENFYILWTGKEAIIKKNLWKLDDMKKFKLEKVENISKNIWWIKFNKKLIITWNLVYNWIYWEKVLAVELIKN